jgi:hypothetical protein
MVPFAKPDGTPSSGWKVDDDAVLKQRLEFGTQLLIHRWTFLAAFPELVSVIPCNLHIKNSGNPMGFCRFSLETNDSPGWLWSAEA